MPAASSYEDVTAAAPPQQPQREAAEAEERAALAPGVSPAGVLAFFEFCLLREQARVTRVGGGPPPYSTHPLLRSTHFCNVSRLDDRGTSAFHAMVSQQQVCSLAGVLWASLVYRRLNRLQTFADWGAHLGRSSGAAPRLPLPSEAAAFCAWLAERRADGSSSFTHRHQTSGGFGAYVAAVLGLAGATGGGAAAAAVPAAVPGCPGAVPLAAALARCTSAADAHAALCGRLAHVGGFIAWQVLCDCVEAGALPACAADGWAHPGPGARTGLRLALGDAAGRGGAHAAAFAALQRAQPWAVASLARAAAATAGSAASVGGVGLVSADPGAPLLCRDLEHALCEFAKWTALQRGGSSPGPFPPAPSSAAAAVALRPPLPPRLVAVRLPGGTFAVRREGADAGGVLAAPGDAGCAAFPPGCLQRLAASGGDAADAAPLLRAPAPGRRQRAPGDGEPLPPRKRPRGPTAPAGEGVSPGRPPAAALAAWWARWWPGAAEAGWTLTVRVRGPGCASAGHADAVYACPAGVRYRSRAEVARAQGAQLVELLPGAGGGGGAAGAAASDAQQAGGAGG